MNKISRRARVSRARQIAQSFELEAMETRRLMSATLTGSAQTITDIETSGPYSSSYAAVSGSRQNSFYASLEVYEFTPSSSVFPTSYKVGDINNINFTQYNTATSGGYGGIAGIFDVYLIPNSDATTPTSSLKFQDTATGGYSDADGLNGQGGATSAFLIGQIAFNNSSTGFGSSVFSATGNGTTGGSIAEQTLVNDLNSGTSFRLAVTPTTETVAADYDGNYSTHTPMLSLSVDQAATTVENFNFNPTSYTVNENAGQATVTVTRDNSSDTASVQYATSDASAVAGTNYTATSGTLNFAIGQSSATFNVPITDVVDQGGNKVLNLTLSNPSAAGVGYAHQVGTNSTATITIVDGANTGSNTETLTQYSYDNATIEKSGSYATTYFNVAGSAAAYPAYGALDFNGTPAFNEGNGTAPVDAPGGAYVFTPKAAITAINAITLNVVQGYPPQGTSGPIDVYVVSDTSDSIDAGNSSFVYDTTQAPEGLDNQMGSKALLGTFNWNASNPPDVFSTESLYGYNQATENMLIADLNSGTQFRIVLTPENSSISASFEGQYGSTYDGYEAPQLSFNVTEAAAATAPTIMSSIVGTGTVQRSTISTIGVTFSEPVSLAAGSFTLLQEVLNADGSINTSATPLDVTSGVSASLSSDKKTLTLSVIPGGSLDRTGASDAGFFANGIYQLKLNGSAVTDAATGTAPLNGGAATIVSFNKSDGSSSNYFHVLFGDFNGDGTVNSVDARQLSKDLLSSTGDTNYDPAFDFNGDGTINTIDAKQFTKDLLQTYSY
jgi:Calx-beta domain/Dockerin type I domain